MSNFPAYTTKTFSPTQKFFVLDPSTGNPAFVMGSDLVALAKNFVYSESTRDTAATTDYPVGAFVQTAGETSAGDNFGATYLVVPAGEGNFPMDNGNELLVIQGDEFLREELVQPVATYNSVAQMVADPQLTVNRKARTLGYYTPGDGGGNDYQIVAGATGTADGGSFIDLDNGLQARGLFTIGPKTSQFGVAADGSDQLSRLQKATDFSNSGKLVHDVVGVTYCSDQINITGFEIEIVCLSGCKFSCDNGIIYHGSTYYDVSNLTQVTSAPLPLQGSGTEVTELQFSSAPAASYEVGAVVKVVCDDLDPYRSENDRRRGQYGVVAQVSGNSVYLTSLLDDEYTTNPRVGVLPKKRVKLLGFDLDNPTLNPSALFNLSGCYKPEVQFAVKRHHGIAMNNIGSWFATFIDCSCEKLETADTALGYLINDCSSESTRIIRPNSEGLCRHVTTTTFNDSIAGDVRLERFGACRRHRVIDGNSVGSLGAAWDSHSGSRYSEWINCQETGTLNSDSAAGSAFQIRGVSERIINGKSSSAPLFCNVLPSAIAPVLDNPISRSARLINVEPSDSGDKFVTINGGESLGSPDPLLVCAVSGRTLVLNGTRFKHRIDTDFRQLFDLENARVINNDTMFDLEVNGGSFRMARSTSGNCRFDGRFKINNSGPQDIFVLQETGGVIGGNFLVEYSGNTVNFRIGPITGTAWYVEKNTDLLTTATNVTTLTEFLENLSTV